MNAIVALERYTPFKPDSARRIDRVIDYFGERAPSRPRRGDRSRAVFELRAFQSRRRTESGVSVTVSLSARTR
jgi:hypothetical protein